MQFLRGTASKLKATNPIPLYGQPCFEKETGRFKIGDGVTAWNSLVFANAPLAKYSRDPLTTDDMYEVGQMWQNTTTKNSTY